jgi:hypothetical protein
MLDFALNNLVLFKRMVNVASTSEADLASLKETHSSRLADFSVIRRLVSCLYNNSADECGFLTM